MCVLVKNLCSPPNNDIEYWMLELCCLRPRSYIFLYYHITIKHIWLEQTFSRIFSPDTWKHSAGFYVHIVSFGSGCARLPNVDSILFVSHYSTPANTSLVLPKPPIFGPSVGYCFFAFYFYYITTPSQQHLEF